jgi:putative DNA primase/helicase
MSDERLTKIKGIGERVKRRVEDAAALIPEPTPPDGAWSIDFVKRCISSNELGMGILYASALRGRYIYDSSAGAWLKWKGHSWSFDVMQTHLAAVETLVDRLLETTSQIAHAIDAAVKEKDEVRKDRLGKLRNRIYSRISYLRSDKGRTKTIKFARTCLSPLSIEGNELDLDPYKLACANGVIDLRTGRFSAGRPEDLISKASPVEWKGSDEPCPAWDRFLLEVMKGDEDLVAFLRRFFGLCISGLIREHKFLIMEGPYGRNGKGTMIETVARVLGSLSGPIPAEMLLDQGHVRSSSAPSPDIMRLRGMRMVWGSESDEGRRFSPSRVKWLTGGDVLTGRHLQAEIVDFWPTHKLILLTNSRPTAPPDDWAFWERLLLLRFDLSYVDRDPIAPHERRSNKDLREQLYVEASGILAWLVRGHIDYQLNGLNPPQSVLEAGSKYRKEEDILAPFIEENIEEKTMADTSASELFDRFSAWYTANISKKGITQTRFGRIMGKRYEKVKVSGKSVYRGIELKKLSTSASELS